MKYIMLFGSIGVGKTTLGQKIEKVCNDITFVSENLDSNIYLPLFYNDMKKYAFHSTIEMLAMMANNYYQKTKNDLYIIDNGVEELICYNNYLLDEKILSTEEYNLYLRVYNAFLKGLPETSLYIYCYTSFDEQMVRIKNRNRDYEKNITEDFILKLNKKYEEFVSKLPKDKVIRLDLTNGVDENELVHQIKAFLNV